MTMTRKIRAIVLCLFQHQERILVVDGFDSVKQEVFCRLGVRWHDITDLDVWCDGEKGLMMYLSSHLD
jgi:hypothetical protein